MNEDTRRLEEKIAFLEHHVTQQDKVILELTEDLARLKREVQLLGARLTGAAGETSGASREADERPPHY